MENFDLIMETNTLYKGVSVSMYKSSRTGLKVLFGNVELRELDVEKIRV